MIIPSEEIAALIIAVRMNITYANSLEEDEAEEALCFLYCAEILGKRAKCLIVQSKEVIEAEIEGVNNASN